MARINEGYVVITDQGDTGRGRPVKYLQMKFPGIDRELLPIHFKQTSNIHDCTIFKLDKPGHRHCLEMADKIFPNAVPVRVTVTRNITIHMELPDEHGTNDLDRKRASIQLP